MLIVALSEYTGQAQAQAQAPEGKPNILVIIDDDVGGSMSAPIIKASCPEKRIGLREAWSDLGQFFDRLGRRQAVYQEYLKKGSLSAMAILASLSFAAEPAVAQKKPNIVVLMSDDTGWADLGAYLGGAALGHPTPNLDRIAKEGALFTNWYGQAGCTAGRASFITGRIPIRSALSVVVVPGDPNGLRKETPTIAEFYQKNGYSTYFSGKWHLGDVPQFYPIEHGFDEMKQFAAYYPGVYGYSDTSPNAHPWFPKGNAEYWKMYTSVVNLYEWEGTAGKPAVKGDNGREITLENLADFDMRQTDSAIEYIKKHAQDSKPFFMD